MDFGKAIEALKSGKKVTRRLERPRDVSLVEAVN